MTSDRGSAHPERESSGRRPRRRASLTRREWAVYFGLSSGLSLLAAVYVVIEPAVPDGAIKEALYLVPAFIIAGVIGLQIVLYVKVRRRSRDEQSKQDSAQ